MDRYYYGNKYTSWGELHHILCREHGHSDDSEMNEDCEECWERYEKELLHDPIYRRFMKKITPEIGIKNHKEFEEGYKQVNEVIEGVVKRYELEKSKRKEK